ncbi:MAG: hypothetical protein HZA20_07300 [Nitrospirae bacterium]|nr:hypothetical protein [Nitrospirota bacterium]
MIKLLVLFAILASIFAPLSLDIARVDGKIAISGLDVCSAHAKAFSANAEVPVVIEAVFTVFSPTVTAVLAPLNVYALQYHFPFPEERPPCN